MKMRLLCFLAFVCFVCGTAIFVDIISAADQEKGFSSKSEAGLHFTVPEDWPIEKRGGVLAPVPVEEYVMDRFKKVESQLGIIKKELEESIGAIRVDVQNLKQDTAIKLDELTSVLESVRGDLRQLNTAVSSSPQGGSNETGQWEGRWESLNRDVSRKLENLVGRLDELEEKKLRSFQFDLGVLEEKVKLLSESLENIK